MRGPGVTVADRPLSLARGSAERNDSARGEGGVDTSVVRFVRHFVEHLVVVRNRNYPTQAISVAGGSGGGTAYLLDGADHNDLHNNLNLPLPFPDAMQEFKVETSAVPARYGHHAAAAVNAVTKSGTNALHGDAFARFT